jgi:hypothetical protein
MRETQPIPELVENRRRSIGMLPAGAPALDRGEALELLEQLKAALHRVEKALSATLPAASLPAPTRGGPKWERS